METPPAEGVEDTLRSQLAARLPESMVPAEFVVLPVFPLLSNGKIDRRALAQEAAQRRSTGGGEAPRDDVERTISQVYEHLLGVKNLGREAHFFNLGGHSLLAVRLAAELGTQGFSVQIHTIFQHPTVAGLAHRLRGLPAAERSPRVQLKSGRGTPLFFLHELEGLAVVYQNLVDHLATERPVYGMECLGLRGEREPVRGIPQLARL